MPPFCGHLPAASIQAISALTAHGASRLKPPRGVHVTIASSSVQRLSASAPPLTRNSLSRYSPALVPVLFRESLSVRLRCDLVASFRLSQAAPHEKVLASTWNLVPGSRPALLLVRVLANYRPDLESGRDYFLTISRLLAPRSYCLNGQGRSLECAGRDTLNDQINVNACRILWQAKSGSGAV